MTGGREKCCDHSSCGSGRGLVGFVHIRNETHKGKPFLLIDEVQEIVKWEKAIVSLAKPEDMDIVITGSNAHMLSSELATLLSGRYIEFPLQTLSLAEFLTFRAGKAGSLEDEFGLYLREHGASLAEPAAGKTWRRSC